MSPILARKTPWSSPQEFISVFDLLFSPNDELVKNQSIGLNHLYAWSIRSPSSLPPAIEATHAILSLLLPPIPNPQQQRLGLAMALTRLVNSLVDPLQTGMYARSIAHIASELGLPLAFVQLRHRATHEELPSHAILLESANLALDWLYTHYWLPRLNHLEGVGHFKRETTTALENLLLSFKRARKRSILDVTQSDYIKILVQINTWIDSAARELRGDGSQKRDIDDEGGFELEPLTELCSIICTREVLIPQSIKKRSQSFKDPLPEPLKTLYEPLIDHLAQSYPDLFMRLLTSTLSNILAEVSEETNDTKRACSSYYYTCVAWLVHLLLRPDGEVMGQETIRSLLIKPTKYTLSVIEKLQELKPLAWFEKEDVSRLIHVFQKAQRIRNPKNSEQGSYETRIENVEQRWEKIITQTEEEIPVQGSTWQLVPESEWSPCPIGCLPDGKVPDLYKSLQF